VVLEDSQGIVRADIPFDAPEAKYSFEQDRRYPPTVYGGALNVSLHRTRRGPSDWPAKRKLGEAFRIRSHHYNFRWQPSAFPSRLVTFGHATFCRCLFFFATTSGTGPHPFTGM